MKFFLMNQYNKIVSFFLLISFLTVNVYAQVRIDNYNFQVERTRILEHYFCNSSWIAALTTEEMEDMSKYSFRNPIRVNSSTLNYRCENGSTPFYLAIREGVSFAVVEKMLELGARVQSRFFEYTALDIHNSSNLEHPEYQETSELLLSVLEEEKEREARNERRTGYRLLCPLGQTPIVNRQGNLVCQRAIY